MSDVYLGRGTDRQSLPLGKLLGEGAAGKVFSVPAMPGAAAKLYHDEAEARKHEAKVEAMIANPPDLPPARYEGRYYPQIAWPEAKLFDRGGRFIGFLMPEIDFARSTSLVNLLQRNSRRVEKLPEYYGYRVLVARNLASVFAELHRAGHHMIDMKPANLRFYPAVSWMAVVDTDGFSITGLHGRVPAEQVSDEYIAPESWKRPVTELDVGQDLFALAVIIFQLLDNGVHPFAGGSKGARGQATDLQARILDGLYPYALKPPVGLEPSTASVHRMFRRATRELFDRAFLPGQERPTAAEWRDHLDELMGQLVPCNAKPDEHVHFGSGCGFCGHEARVTAAASRPRPLAAPRRAARKPLPRLPVPTPPRTIAARPMAMLPSYPAVGTQAVPRPHRRRRTGLWRGLAVLVLLAGTAAGTQGLWMPLLAGSGDARTANRAALVPDVPVSDFREPIDYLILPSGDALSVPLRGGPGEDYAVIDRLALHDSVIGRGTSRDSHGNSWIYVVREEDGATGFVPATALLERGARSRAANNSGPPNRALAERYRQLLETTAGYDGAYLSEGQKLWEEDRERCGEDLDPAACRAAVDARRMAELDSWEEAATISNSPMPEFNLSGIDALP